ncbi:MAG: hypothetical protein ACE5E5_15275 [Phycisphaerae bacterium]
MASSKPKSVWTVLERLGHQGRDRDDIIEHVFENTSRLTVRSDDGEPMDGGDFLVEVFESLGTTKDWPGCGSPEWVRLRFRALTMVVKRLGREGLLDAIAVGCATDAEGETETPAAKDEGSASNAVDCDETQEAKYDGADPRVGVQAYRAMIRRGRRNPSGWFRLVNRDTPYRVIVRWAAEACPGVAMESLVALLDGLREVKWWDDDGHLIGGELVSFLESELEEGRDHEQWLLVVSDFDEAIRMLRSVFERLSLL